MQRLAVCGGCNHARGILAALSSKSVCLTSVLLGALIGLFAGLAQAADYPTRHITLYVGYPPGGATDTAARIVTNQVSKYLEYPMVVNNKPGAGSAVAGDFVAKAKPDGYSLLSATATTVILTVASRDNPFKMSDFTPIVGLYSMPLVMVVRGDSKLNSIEDFVDYAKKNPNKLDVGTPGINSVHHFGLELFKKEAGIDVNHVPFQGDAPAAVGVIGGHVEAAFLGLVAVAEPIKSGKMKALAMTTAKRVAQFPSLPTMAEKGYARTGNIVSWGGVAAPAGLPAAILEKLSAAYQKAANNPEVISQLEKVGFSTTYMNAREFNEFVRDEYKRMMEVAQSAKMIN